MSLTSPFSLELGGGTEPGCGGQGLPFAIWNWSCHSNRSIPLYPGNKHWWSEAEEVTWGTRWIPCYSVPLLLFFSPVWSFFPQISIPNFCHGVILFLCGYTPGLQGAPSCWAVLTQDRQSKVLVANGADLFILDSSTCTAVVRSCYTHTHTHTNMAPWTNIVIKRFCCVCVSEPSRPLSSGHQYSTHVCVVQL